MWRGARKPWELVTKQWFLPQHRYVTGDNEIRLGAAAEFNHHRRQHPQRNQQHPFDQWSWVSRIEILEEASRGMGGKSWRKLVPIAFPALHSSRFCRYLFCSWVLETPLLAKGGMGWDGQNESAYTYPEVNSYMKLNILFWQSTSTWKQQLIGVEHDFF